MGAGEQNTRCMPYEPGRLGSFDAYLNTQSLKLELRSSHRAGEITVVLAMTESDGRVIENHSLFKIIESPAAQLFAM
jgi:hypothetical protein